MKINQLLMLRGIRLFGSSWRLERPLRLLRTEKIEFVFESLHVFVQLLNLDLTILKFLHNIVRQHLVRRHLLVVFGQRKLIFHVD